MIREIITPATVLAEFVVNVISVQSTHAEKIPR
jgi:hypothetical protein